MKYINCEDLVVEDVKKSFEQNGFVKIKSFFTKEFVDYIKGKIDESINKPVDKYQTGFNRIAFDLFNDDEIIMNLMQDVLFKKFMSVITSKKIFFTQALAFELKKEESKGFPWHIGTQSFGYQFAEDFGCTIWMPLDKIDTKKQRGGMAYVPESIISGKFMYEFIDPSIALHIEEKNNNNDNPKLDDYLNLRDGVLNDKSLKTLLEHFGVEDDFEIGDLLLFNKNVIHTSIKLYEGELETRKAFVMRFIDANSKYDKKRALGLEYPRELFSYTGCTRFHLDVCKEDGEMIVNSDYFKNSSERSLYL